jgi:hypothetical protein
LWQTKRNPGSTRVFSPSFPCFWPIEAIVCFTPLGVLACHRTHRGTPFPICRSSSPPFFWAPRQVPPWVSSSDCSAHRMDFHAPGTHRLSLHAVLHGWRSIWQFLEPGDLLRAPYPDRRGDGCEFHRGLRNYLRNPVNSKLLPTACPDSWEA